MTHIHRRWGVAITVTAFCALCSLTAQSALADEHDHGSRDRGGHDYRQHARNAHRDYGYDRRYYSDGRYRDGGYAPPIVYAPPEPTPGIRLVIPLHFR